MPAIIAVNYEDAMHAKYDDMGWCTNCNDFQGSALYELDDTSIEQQCHSCGHDTLFAVEAAKKEGMITF